MLVSLQCFVKPFNYIFVFWWDCTACSIRDGKITSYRDWDVFSFVGILQTVLHFLLCASSRSWTISFLRAVDKLRWSVLFTVVSILAYNIVVWFNWWLQQVLCCCFMPYDLADVSNVQFSSQYHVEYFAPVTTRVILRGISSNCVQKLIAYNWLWKGWILQSEWVEFYV